MTRFQEKKKSNRAFQMRVSCFMMIQGKLNKKSMTSPYLRCLESHEATNVLKDIHEGGYGNYVGRRCLCSKVLRTGYEQQKMKKDVLLNAHKCDVCQRNSNILHKPVEPLYPIIPPWPFMKWGMDILGKLPKAHSGMVFILVMMDYL